MPRGLEQPAAQSLAGIGAVLQGALGAAQGLDDVVVAERHIEAQLAQPLAGHLQEPLHQGVLGVALRDPGHNLGRLHHLRRIAVGGRSVDVFPRLADSRIGVARLVD